jgi:hypothetical protein
MRQLKLIIEAKDYILKPVDVIIESIEQEDKSYKKQYYIEGPFIQTEIKNKNGRRYLLDIMKECVEKYKAEKMNPDGYASFGELSHPDGVEINLDRVSHYTTKLDWQGKDCIGKAKILTANPCGRIVQTFLEDKLRIGTSTRCLGALSENVNSDGSKNVESCEMLASDIVADPSAPQGFVDGILENKEYIIKDNGLIVECYNKLEATVSNLPRKSDDRNKLFLSAFQTFMKNLK